MSHSQKSLLLEDEIGLLIKHFGIERVRAVIAKFSREGWDNTKAPRKPESNHLGPPPRPVASDLDLLRETEPEKYRLLSEFFGQLKEGKVLPESQDIRYFAQIVGLKEIRGKARADMIPKLMRFLLEQPIERLRSDIRSAGTISEQQRQRGFSVLTDKLVGKL